MAVESKTFEPLGAWMQQKLALDRTPGLSLVITDRKQTLYTGVYGLADIAAGTPVNPRHLFEIGSIGKSFTALVLLRMLEQGLIDLHAPVTEYLPWFAVQSDHAPITLHHLMTHTAGIISGSDMAADGRFEAWHLRQTGVLGPPGERFSYSNVGYKVLGYVIEVVLGRPYSVVVADEILRPLGMTDSIAAITHADRRRLAVGYRWPDPIRPRRPGQTLVPDVWIETSSADGSIAATPENMASYARFLLGRGAGLISDESFSLMSGDLVPRDPDEPEVAWGYGLYTWEQDGRTLLGHGGDMIGYFAQLTLDPDAGIGVVAMLNGPGDEAGLADAALAFTRDVLAGATSPRLPPLNPPTVIDNATEYAGHYAGQDEEWTVVADGTALHLEWNGQQAVLERWRRDRFFVHAPELEHDLVGFERIDDQVVALHHGRAWFGRDGAILAEPEMPPAHWTAYPGLYRCHNPWQPMIEVLERRGNLILVIFPGYEQPLVELEDGRFQIGGSPSVERLRFDAIADGLALRADLSGQAFYRTPESSIRPR
jgi:CubicO group peptidase (beta-lactamase class C family)